MENKKNLVKIIIVTFVIIIIFVSIILGIVLLSRNKQNGNNEILVQNTNEEDKEQEENDNILQNENIIINDNFNEELNRKYGKIEIVWIDENNNVIENALAPNLGGLTPLKYDIMKNSFEKVSNPNSEQWYDYENEQWANAMAEDGSYFVWIPRFAYRIVYYANADYSKVIGYTDGRGILKLNTDGSFTRIAKNNTGIRETKNHYIVATAFSKDTASGYKNGGWNKDLAGFWIAKYEMSMETNGTHTETISQAVGNVLTSDNIKAVSKPSVSSWRNINVKNCYLNSFNYDRNRDSHLIKNSEWGAVTYLSYSKYGTNGRKIENNNNSQYITGGSNNEKSVYVTNINQSSTGNATGVYDLSGGAWEYTAAYIDNGYLGLKQNGGETEEDLYGSRNSKYKTVYSHNASDKGNDYNAMYSNNNYKLSLGVRGDSIFETSNSGYGNEGWEGSAAFFPQGDIPFFIRGGDYNSSVGLFSFNGYSGSSNSGESFRVVLAF